MIELKNASFQLHTKTLPRDGEMGITVMGGRGLGLDHYTILIVALVYVGHQTQMTNDF